MIQGKMFWPKTDTAYYHTQRGLPDKGCVMYWLSAIVGS